MRSAAVLAIASYVVCLAGCALLRSPSTDTKVIVIGIDGLDPGFLERHWSELPNLDRLRKQGGFRRLGTTTPPQSPVAWSTFITGADPSAHGIYDFVHRNPATLQPLSSLAVTEDPRFVVPLGPYMLPLTQAHVRTLRRGRSFWELLAERGIATTVIHMPMNYPPVAAGQAIAGMGVPDLRGTLGTFTLYTSEPEEISREVPGGRIVKLQLHSNRAVLPVQGPPNPLRKDHRTLSVDLTLDVDSRENIARIKLSDAVAIVKRGEWSPWLPVDFPILGKAAAARGMVRAYLKQVSPGIALYLSPLNVDPLKPDLPISYPGNFSSTVARQLGAFGTLGIAEDTSALRQGVFSLPEFLQQSRLVFADELNLLRYSLKQYKEGLLFFYFSSIDQNSHVLWGKHESELADTYRAVDGAVGEVLRAQPAADLIILSDHGFTTFDRAFHLNTWLRQQGYLALKNSAVTGEEMLADVDWSRTRAYGIGLNGLYLNLAGREQHGIVHAGGESRALLEDIGRKLRTYRDPANARFPVETTSALKSEPDTRTPDLVVGYAPGYRASWQSALGAAPEEIVVANNDAWIADHCVNPSAVPGVLLMNRSIRANNPQLKDVTVSLLALFGVRQVAGLTGQVVY